MKEISKLIILANKLDQLGFNKEADEVDVMIPGFDKPILQTSPGKDDESITLEWLNVPEEQRGKGVGKKTYLDWEKNLPGNIKRVYLYAADLGSGSSIGFWKSLGFVAAKDTDTDTPLMIKELR